MICLFRIIIYYNVVHKQDVRHQAKLGPYQPRFKYVAKHDTCKKWNHSRKMLDLLTNCAMLFINGENMQIDMNSAYGMGLRLAMQTNPDKVNETSIRLAEAWAPATAKSFTITSLVHTDYHGNSVVEPTGYATIYVDYFTRKNEGDNPITKNG